ncbi:MAG: hypothetical protein WC304_03785 [Candidatus Gracilibacteria bacterium]|jgi:hypothetical protein
MQSQLPLTSRNFENREIISLRSAQNILTILALLTAFLALVELATY